MKIIIIFWAFLFVSCNIAKNELVKSETVEQNDIENVEIKELFLQDQLDREEEDIDWSIVSVRDSLREKRVYELLESDQTYTARDYRNAAVIFSHGRDTLSSKMAIIMMQKAIELDPTLNKSILAKAIDKDLMRRNKPQIYGTQKIKNKEDNWVMYQIDTTKVSDQERSNYDIEPLDELRIKIENLNF